MNIFIHDTYIKVFEKNWLPNNYAQFYDWQNNPIDYAVLEGDVWIKLTFLPTLLELTHLIVRQRFPKLRNLYLQVPDRKSAKEIICEGFRCLDAAGGVVYKENKILMIHRLGVWDLPKGKLEKKEDFRLAAIREVEEECNITVKLAYRIVTTWHHYEDFNGQDILKRTKWYAMHCLDDRQMKPQTEEDIDKVSWLDKSEIWEVQPHTYRTIQLVLARAAQLQSDSND